MGTDSNGSGVRDGDGSVSPADPSRKGDRIGDPLSEALPPGWTRSIETGIKVLFTGLLTALLVYWVAAFFFGVVLFEL